MNRWLDSREVESIRMMDSWLVRRIMASYTHGKLMKYCLMDVWFYDG